MTPLISWLVIIGFAVFIYSAMSALYKDSIKNDKDNR